MALLYISLCNVCPWFHGHTFFSQQLCTFQSKGLLFCCYCFLLLLLLLPLLLIFIIFIYIPFSWVESILDTHQLWFRRLKLSLNFVPNWSLTQITLLTAVCSNHKAQTFMERTLQKSLPLVFEMNIASLGEIWNIGGFNRWCICSEKKKKKRRKKMIHRIQQHINTKQFCWEFGSDCPAFSSKRIFLLTAENRMVGLLVRQCPRTFTENLTHVFQTTAL